MRSKEQMEALEEKVEQLEQRIRILEEKAAGKKESEPAPARKTARK